MGKVFDFAKVKRSYFTVTTKSGQTLQVKMPVKRVFDKVMALDTNASGAEAIYALDVVCAELLSNNVAGVTTTTDEVSAEYDLEEKLAFLNAYMEFVTEAGKNPN